MTRFRPPGTLNHKHIPPRPVRLLLHRPHARYELADLTARLPPDPCRSRKTTASRVPAREGRTPLEQALLAIPAAEYARVLVDASPNRDGKILCPFHNETVPSLHLYPDGTFYCFGSRCRKGGTLIDFAANLWRIPPRRDGFTEILARLAEHFHLQHLCS